jgi:RNA 2',3'-cyclic 3'-phosphodiesterase
LKRLFAGIELSESAREACAAAAERLRAAGLAAAYERPEKFHLTLAFLGNVEDERCAGIEAALREAAASVAAFELTLDRIGAFPNERRPRIVFLGARDAGPGFRSAAAALRSAYGRLGCTFADDAVAHVTVARIKGGARHPAPAVELAPVRCAVAELALFESHYDPAARSSRYEIRVRAGLGRQPA